jgi:hypothetical protein
MTQPEKLAHPVTASGIVRIVGPLEDDVIASIVSTRATEAEVLEAVKWFTADDGLGAEVRHTRTGRVAQVYDILAAAEAQYDDELDAPVQTPV